jgi:regulatory protein
MAVRFLPDHGERPAEAVQDRGDLAEVIELRALLARREWSARAESAVVSGESSGISGESPGVSGESSGVPCDSSDIPGESVDASGEAPSVPGLRGTASIAGPWGETPGSPAQLDDAGSSATEREGPSANEDGVRILARRARSSGELRDELLRLEHDPHEVENVIAEFEGNHYLDDLGLARAVTEKLRDTKRASRSQIRLKLRDRKLPDAVIDEAVGELDTDEEFAILRETAQDRARKLTGLDRQTAERRLLGFLARRGWSGEPAMRAARDALDGASRGGGASGGVRFR